jgi:hypothetical protein
MSQDAYLLKVRNVNHALPRGLSLLREYGHQVSPRGKQTLEYPGPVMTMYTHPQEMVLFDPVRDANPFFHFFEALWILAGRSDVAFLAQFLPKIREFSDDGVTFHAPYGERLRQLNGNGFDQIERAIALLRDDHDSRQVVMSIWDSNRDLNNRKIADRPCNDMVMLKIREGALRMTVSIRSNDIVWGAYGANAVQFATLLKYMAGRIGVGVGTLTQVSDSYHVYTDLPYWQTWVNANLPHHTPAPHDPYIDGDEDIVNSSFMTGEELESGVFDHDLQAFFSAWDDPANAGVAYLKGASFNNTVQPMYQAHQAYKTGNLSLAMDRLDAVQAHDWRLAAQQWAQRRIDRRATA